MATLPYVTDINVKSLTPDSFDRLIENRYCFYLDSAHHTGQSGRYSFFGINPVRIFSSSGGFITVDGHTYIDNPLNALKEFEKSLINLPTDPYLPFTGGLVGFVGHNWPVGQTDMGNTDIPDAWFGLFDTVLTFDHLEQSCWISSFGLSRDGRLSLETAQKKCEELASQLIRNPKRPKETYVIKTLMPKPVSEFDEPTYVNAIKAAKNCLTKDEWQRVNLAQRFHAPISKRSWSIHKHLRDKNPTPYSSFLKCGNFELSSISPSCFLNIHREKITCNVAQKSIARKKNPLDDKLDRSELLYRSADLDPAVVGDGLSVERVIKGKPRLDPAHIESDSKTHYLVNKIEGKKAAGCRAPDCLAAAMPGASMTGVPKFQVNNWLRKIEPAKRNIYTGAIGLIDTSGNARFNMAVRTMVVKDQVAYIHSGQPISETTNGEESFVKAKTNINNLFEEIRSIRGDV